MQFKVERTGTNPTTATITTRAKPGAPECVCQAKDEANAIALTDAFENAEGGSKLGVWQEGSFHV